tara:strand:- start:161 stop:388 length:228 start_codon:yes stop_codon:yes gene_type:complete
MNQSPWWIRLIGVTGVSGAIALYLVYFLATSVIATIEQHDLNTAQQLRELVSISRQICVNGSPSPQEREGCFRGD